MVGLSKLVSVSVAVVEGPWGGLLSSVASPFPVVAGLRLQAARTLPPLLQLPPLHAVKTLDAPLLPNPEAGTPSVVPAKDGNKRPVCFDNWKFFVFWTGFFFGVGGGGLALAADSCNCNSFAAFPGQIALLSFAYVCISACVYWKSYISGSQSDSEV